ncbi:MAG: hypothetical protein ACYC27_21200 [Armatimonadota bacterium]
MNDQLQQRQIDYVRGKIAGNDVFDDKGDFVVKKDELITDDVIKHALDSDQLHYLMIAAVSTVVNPDNPDFDRRLKEFGSVIEGHEARFVRGKMVRRDVKDINGGIVARDGDVVTNDIIQRAENMGMLQDLVLAVGAPRIISTGPCCPEETGTTMDVDTASEFVPISREE